MLEYLDEDEVADKTDYPQDSYYTHSAYTLPKQPPLDKNITVDVAIVGGGYTGLSAALHLAEQGASVAILEAKRVGWGASGRNGGQIHSGQRQDAQWFEARFGKEAAKDYFQLGEAGKHLVLELIAKHQIDCDLKWGLIHAAHKERFVPEFQAHAEHMARHYNHELEWLDAEKTAKRLGTDAYYGSLYDPAGGHLHPLKFAVGLARAAQARGCKIFEGTKVKAIKHEGRIRVVTTGGQLSAVYVLLCGNGYLEGIESRTEARVMPLNNFIAATRPLRADEVPLPGDECASDSRFVINYWRMSADRRLLFGGGETYCEKFPKDIARFVRKPMAKIYPQFKDIEIDFAWGGTLALTVHRVPYLKKIAPRFWAAGGYSGQGVTIAPLAGQIMAEAIFGEKARFDMLEALPVPRFPGGVFLRAPMLAAGMSWFALRDRL